MQRLSRSHPLYVISFSRIIPVLPFSGDQLFARCDRGSISTLRPVDLGYHVARGRFFWPREGNLLHSGITGRTSIEAAVVLGVAGVGLGVVVHRMRKKIYEGGDGGLAVDCFRQCRHLRQQSPYDGFNALRVGVHAVHEGQRTYHRSKQARMSGNRGTAYCFGQCRKTEGRTGLCIHRPRLVSAVMPTIRRGMFPGFEWLDDGPERLAVNVFHRFAHKAVVGPRTPR